jgi:hypothetical protein
VHTDSQRELSKFPDHEQVLALLFRIRAEPSKVFNVNLFGDPAWDMLLNLYRAHLFQHRLTVTRSASTRGSR